MSSRTRAEKHGIEKGPLADYLNKMTDTDGNSLENWFKKTYADPKLLDFAQLLNEVDKLLREDEREGEYIDDRHTELCLSIELTKHHSKGLEPKIIVQGGKLEVHGNPQR